jgi:hypothetical protein
MPNRILTLIVAAMLTLSACSKKSKEDASNQQPEQSKTEQAATAPAPSPPSPTPDQTSTANQTQPAPAQATESRPAHKAQHNPLPQSDAGSESLHKRAEATPPPPPPPVVIPAGTAITIRLSQAIDAKTSKAGDRFIATVAQPVALKGKTVIPQTSPARGQVVEAASAGKIKGEGKLSVRLTEISIQGVVYPVSTIVLSSETKSKGKRSAAMIGGGAGAGALIGGLAGGGKGAAIGALAGGAAGTAGATMTGNKQVGFPAESVLTFELTKPITLGAHNRTTEATEPVPPQ